MVPSISKPTGQREQNGDSSGRFDDWLLSGAIALLVARPLVTSDAADYQGDGALFVMLWLLLTLGWAISAVRSRQKLRFAWIDAAVLALIVWHTVAALLAVTGGRPRPALNLLWEWLALGLVYFLLRQLACTAVQRRGLMAAMVCLATGLSAMGFFQFFVGAPRDRAQYERIKGDPVAMLRVVGHYFPPGSAERRRFEDRLYSDEPTATFALANSLAGFLAPWLIVLVGTVSGGRGARRLRGYLWCSLVPAAMIAGCLLLTKSRSGWLAVLAGAVVLAVGGRLGRGPRQRLPGRWIGVAALVVWAVAWLGGIDRAVWTQAAQSFRYRLEYWRATVAMIGDQPWFGCGPGQFQDAYTRYKLPQASEEVRDPHNFLLEISATAGLPGGILMIAVLALFVISLRTRSEITRPVHVARSGKDDPGPMPRPPLAGLICGFVLAAVAGPLFGFGLRPEYFLAGALGAAATLWIAGPWIRDGGGQTRLTVAGVATLCVHLLATGGIAYPGVAGTLWLLLAIGLNDAGAGRCLPSSPRAAWLLVGAAALGMVACFATFYRPVLTSRAHRTAALAAPALQHDTTRGRALLAAVQADPLDARSAQMLAAHRHEQYLLTPSAENRQQLESAIDGWLRLAPQSSAAWGQVGRWWFSIYRRVGDAEALRHAERCLARAVRRYPTSPAHNADYAVALHQRGKHRQASARAKKSLHLERMLIDAGHVDKRLPNDVRRQLNRIVSSDSN